MLIVFPPCVSMRFPGTETMLDFSGGTLPLAGVLPPFAEVL